MRLSCHLQDVVSVRHTKWCSQRKVWTQRVKTLRDKRPSSLRVSLHGIWALISSSTVSAWRLPAFGRMAKMNGVEEGQEAETTDNAARIL